MFTLSSIKIPGTCETLTEGSVVKLARFPDTKWTVHEGWYTYMEESRKGWYLSSIPAQNILPLTETDLYMIIPVSVDSCDCNHHHHHHPGIPDVEMEKMDLKKDVERAWMTVNTERDLHILEFRNLPDGKVVKVQKTGKYYAWDRENETWIPENFGIDLSPYYTKEEIEEKYYSKSDIDDMGLISHEDSRIVSIDGGTSSDFEPSISLI